MTDDGIISLFGSAVTWRKSHHSSVH